MWCARVHYGSRQVIEIPRRVPNLLNSSDLGSGQGEPRVSDRSRPRDLVERRRIAQLPCERRNEPWCAMTGDGQPRPVGSLATLHRDDPRPWAPACFTLIEGSRDAASSVAGLSLSAPTWTRKTTAQTDTFWAGGSRSASSRRWSRDDERKSSELDASIGTGDPIERLSLENVSLA
jgi:hypothetical protein